MHAVIGARPPVVAVLFLEEVDAVAVDGADDQRPGLRVEARRSVIRAASLVGRHQPAVARRLLLRIRDRPAVLVDFLCPVHRRERGRQEVLPRSAIEHEKVPVARRLQQQFSRCAVDRCVDQHGHFRGVPVVGVVGRRLKSPRERAGIGIERDDAAGPGIVAGPHRSVEDGRGVARSDEHQVQIRIVGAGDPHLSAGGAAADGTGRTGRRRAEERPLQLAGFRLERFQHAGQVVEVARDADDQMIANDERRIGGPVAALGFGDLHVPSEPAVPRVERDEVRVGGRQVDQVLVNRRAAMPDVKAFVLRIRVAPQLPRGTGIDRPDIVGSRDVDDAIGKNRRRLDLPGLPRLKRPRERQLMDVVGGYLRETRVPLSRVVAVVSRPAVGRRLQQRCRIQSLRGNRRECATDATENSDAAGDDAQKEAPHFFTAWSVCR